MSAPSWIRRLSESDENHDSTFELPQVSLYTPCPTLGSRSNLSHVSNYRSTENLSDQLRRASRDSVSSYGNVSEHYQPRTFDRRRSSEDSNYKYGIVNSGYISEVGSTLRSNPSSHVDLESVASSKYTTASGSRGRLYTGREPRETEKTRYSSPLSRQAVSSTNREPNRDDSWSYVDSEGYARLPPSIRTSVSYGDFEGSSTSGSPCPSRNRDNHSAASSTVESTDRKQRYHRKQRDQHGGGEETRSSGYNSYSELSEFTSPSKSGEHRRTSKSPPPNRDLHNEHERCERYTKFPKKTHNRSNDDKMSNSSSHKRSESRLSMTESDISGSSKEKAKKRSHNKVTSSNIENKQTDSKTAKAPTIGNVAVTVTNNITYDPNDPFSFIQPVDLPFHMKVRKCLMPILIVLSLLILAAALGAAIYFASALKETHEKQIDLLRANLAVKIRNIDRVENIEDLSSGDFKSLSLTYCKHMDIFYAKSMFSKTYRGCEVVSIKNSYINFTLFFDEKEATSTQILDVIESSANKVTDDSEKTQFAVVDQFELELDSVEVKMDRRLEPETFNKKSASVIQTTSITPTSAVDNTKSTSTSSGATSKEKLKTSLKPTTMTTTTASNTKKTSPKNKPVYSWNPCEEYEGTYFPHPAACDSFIQCTNGQMIVNKCAKGLLYHWKELTCVSRFMPNVECPDPSKVPPKPTRSSVVSTSSTTVAAPTRTTTLHTILSTVITEKVQTQQSTTKRFVPEGVVLSAIAGKYSERPKYSANPCVNAEDAKLYPHPDDCAMFIQCVNGKVQHMKCAPKLVFDPTNSACIFPTDKDLQCPDIKPCQHKDDGYFPHPYDCSKFIQCQFKKELVLACQDGLVWSTSVNSCVHKTKSSICPLDPKR